MNAGKRLDFVAGNLTLKRGESRVRLSYSPPSPQTLLPYRLWEMTSEQESG